jgi:hypothetical protein
MINISNDADSNGLHVELAGRIANDCGPKIANVAIFSMSQSS